MKLKTLPASTNLQGKRVLLRLDWNVPLTGGVKPEESLKIERSLNTIHGLVSRGAVVIVLTHLGRPDKPDPHFSTKHLVSLLKHHYQLVVHFHPESVSQKAGHATLEAALAKAEPGSIHLLENVRFEKGEEKNDRRLSQAYASLANMFINDAFASSHRSHTSVVGIAKYVSSYAGPELQNEIAACSKVLHKPTHPFLGVIGGFKLSTKIPVITALLKTCDRICIGGAMATAFLAARGMSVGASAMEEKGAALAKKLLKEKKILLPVDVVVTNALHPRPALRVVSVTDIASEDMIVDIGPKTLASWAAEIKRAKTILWNGPVGLVEIEACGAGSRFVARALARRAQSQAFVIAGGGDTLPVIIATRTEKRFDHVSTGGGALLEFLSLKGNLPGVMPFAKIRS